MAVPAGQSLGFTLPSCAARGRLVRPGALVDEILGTHAYPPPVARLLAEALTLTALLGSLLVEEEGQLTLQVRGEGGPLALLVADYRGGELRGYAALDLDRRLPPDAGDLQTLFGAGQLVLTVDQIPGAERYQGIIDLDAPSLEAAAQRYFSASEQVPTLVRLAAVHGTDGRWQTGGLLLQRLPDGDEEAGPAFEHAAVLGGSVRESELTDPALSADRLLWRLFHEQEVRVFPARQLRRGCRCSEQHIRAVLDRFPATERVEMRGADGRITVDCAFCARQFLFDL